MPPIYQDPLSAVRGAEWRWLDIARALVEVACEPWALAVVALAVYSFYERDVKGVLKAVLPLALALAAAGGLAVAARAIGGVPRPLEATAHALGPLLRRAFPSGQAASVAVFVTFTALTYGRRAAVVALVAVAVGVTRALGGPHWATELACGALAGFLLAILAYAATLRLLPGGHVARLRAVRHGAHASPDPGSP